MTIEVCYKNGNFEQINMRFCCKTLSFCKNIGLKEQKIGIKPEFYMALERSEIVQHKDDYHVTIKHEYLPVSFCPFCGEEIEIEEKEVSE